MLRFCLKVAVFALLIVLPNLLFFYLLPNQPDSGAYLAAINDKFARLAATPAPRIIFVGTSDLAFGLDSTEIEQTFHRSVVNMGLHGTTGPRLDLESIRPYIQRGDIILYSGLREMLADQYFYGRDDGTGIHLWLIKYRPETLAAMNSPQQWMLLVNEYPDFIKTMLTIGMITRFQAFYPRTPPLEIPYRRSGFDDHGDMVAHLELASRPWSISTRPAPTNIGPPKISADNIAYLNDYHTFVTERGASIYIIPRPIAAATVAQTPGVIRQLDPASVTIPFLGLPEEYQFPDDEFFDNPEHLNKAGRKDRTKRVIKDLTKLLGQSAQPVVE